MIGRPAWAINGVSSFGLIPWRVSKWIFIAYRFSSVTHSFQAFSSCPSFRRRAGAEQSIRKDPIHGIKCRAATGWVVAVDQRQTGRIHPPRLCHPEMRRVEVLWRVFPAILPQGYAAETLVPGNHIVKPSGDHVRAAIPRQIARSHRDLRRGACR